MGYMVKRTVVCQACGKLFEIDIPAKVYSNETDLKKLIFNGEILFRKCPYCEEEINYPHPFMYIDEEKEFIIHVNGLDEHITYYENNLKYKKDSEKILELGVTSLADLQSKIIMLENGLDYRIGTLYQLAVESKALSMLKTKDQKAFIDRSRYIYMDDKFGVEVYFASENGIEYKKPFQMIFIKELYDQIYNREIPYINNMYTFSFDCETAHAYMCKRIHNLKRDDNEMTQFALVEYQNGNLGFAFVPVFNEGKYYSGEDVCVMKDGDICAVTIKKLYRMCDYDVPIDLESPTIAYKLSNIEIESSQDSDAELGNEEYVENILKQFPKVSIDDFELSKKDVIIGIEYSANADDLLDMIKDNNLDVNKINSKICSDYYNDGTRYLKVFFNQKDFNEDTASRVVMKFDDVIRIVVNSPNRFDGIVMVLDKDEPCTNLSWTHRRITEFRKNSFMLDAEKMKKLMLTINNREKEYLQQLSYDCIYKVYVENKVPKEIAKELNVPFKDVDEALGYGYGRLKHIVWDNY